MQKLVDNNTKTSQDRDSNIENIAAIMDIDREVQADEKVGREKPETYTCIRDRDIHREGERRTAHLLYRKHIQ